MSKKLGFSHRQVVKDTNAGRIQPTTVDSPQSRRGVTGASQQVTVSLGNKSVLKDALMRSVGEIGTVIANENRRKDILRGENMAATAEGRAKVEEASGGLLAKFFGENRTIRAAQERIVTNDVDDAYLELRTELQKGGYELDDKDWNKVIADKLDKFGDKHTDEGIRDLITNKFSKNLGALQRDRAKAHEAYKADLKRDTVEARGHKTGELVSADLESKDPDRAADAEKRMGDFYKELDTFPRSTRTKVLANVLKNELTQGRDAMTRHALESGQLDVEKMEPADRESLQVAMDLFDDKMNMQHIENLSVLDFKVANSSIEEVDAHLEKILSYNKQALPQGKKPYIKAAFAAEVARNEAAAIAHQEKEDYKMGGMSIGRKSVEKQQAAAETAFDEMAEKAIMDDPSRDPKQTPSRAELLDWRLKNPTAWAPTWGKNNIPVDSVTTVVRSIDSKVTRIDLTKEQAADIKNNLQTIGSLKVENATLLDKQFDSDEQAARLVGLHQDIIRDGMPVVEALQRQRLADTRRAEGREFKLVGEEGDAIVKKSVDSLVKDFIREKGRLDMEFIDPNSQTIAGAFPAVTKTFKTLAMLPDAISDLLPFGDKADIAGRTKDIWADGVQFEQDLRFQYESAFRRSYHAHGVPGVAEREARAAVSRGSAIVNGSFVLGGASLDKNSVNGSFEKQVAGLNDDPEFRKRLIAKGHKMDFNLLNNNNQILPDADGKAATIWMKSGDGVPSAVRVNTAQTEEDIIPTQKEKLMQERRDAFKKRPSPLKPLPQGEFKWW